MVSWRTQIKQIQLVSQISSILLQRHHWAPLLHNLNLSSNLTPFIFLQILYKTQTHPLISLKFFNWAKSNLNFQPDLKSQCHLFQLCIGSGLSQPANTILDSLIPAYPVNVLMDTLAQSCRGKNHQSNALSFVLEYYSYKGLLADGLEVYRKMRVVGCAPSIHVCNSILNNLERKNEVKLGLCFYGSMIRVGILWDTFSWSLLPHFLCNDGKFERVVKLLDMGICNSGMYNVVVDWYSRNGDFGAAFYRLNEMRDRNLCPGFCTYSSMLDGACKCRDVDMIDKVMAIMVMQGLLPNPPFADCGPIIQKLCDLRKANAATMFFKRACDERIELQDAIYGGMLKAYSKGGMVEEAIDLYRMITEKGITIKNSAYYAFIDLLCGEDRSEEGYGILNDFVSRGFIPSTSNLSKFISSLCNERKWREVEEMLNVVLEKGLLPDSLPCCLLVQHYCSSRQIDKAVALHARLEKLQGSLDVTTYNVLLEGLVKEGRIEESIRVFGYVKGLELVNGASFTIVIRGLCRAKELRKAMKLHDEMLSMELKPDKTTYKRLILEFKQ